LFKRSWLLFVLVLGFGFLAACSPSASAPTAASTTAPTAEVPALLATPGTGNQSAGNSKQWSAPPAMQIDPKKIYVATLKTVKGDIKIELLAAFAPKTVNNFVFLAREGYYNGTTFHRVLDNFMAQGGDPTGTGSGGPGYQFEDEIVSTLSFDGPGWLAMANAGPGTNGSQFFITYTATTWLNGNHTIFGKVIEGLDVALSLTRRDPGQNPGFAGDVLQTVIIEEGSTSLLPPIPTPAPTPTPLPTVSPVMQAGRPLGKLDIAKRENLFTGVPALVVDAQKAYTASVITTKGTFTVELHVATALQSVNNFVVLARLGYWDNFPIVFVNEQFALTGSPAGNPASDVGYGVPKETTLLNKQGAVGLWYRQDLDAASGSQFYVLLQDNPQMDGFFSVFGTVTGGMEVVKTLTIEDKITSIEIEEQ